MPLREFSTRYDDVLQNIESAIVRVHRAHAELLDYDVEGALEALIARYSAEEQGREARPSALPGLRQDVFDAVQPVCEWRLGRKSLTGGAAPEPKSVAEIVACLKRIRKSVQRWNREGGRQGYLRFVGRYL